VLCINHHCDILKIGDDSYHYKNGADPPSDPGQYCTLTPGQIWTLIDTPAGPGAKALFKTPSTGELEKGEPLPKAVGDHVPRGGRFGEAKPRTGGPAWSPSGMFVGGPAKPEQAPTHCHCDSPKEAPEIIDKEKFSMVIKSRSCYGGVHSLDCAPLHSLDCAG
jgi:hypothetical protein